MKVYVIECLKLHSHFIYDIYDNEENAKKALRLAEHDHRDCECRIIEHEISTTAPVFTVDFNEIQLGKDKFKLKGSDHIFIAAEISHQVYDFALVDLTSGVIYDVEEVADYKSYDFNFYRKENDEDYWGVEPVEED